MARGRPPRLVDQAWEYWPIETLPQLPEKLKGLYVLYDPRGVPVRVGIAGRGRQDVRSRLLNYYDSKDYRHVASFSVYTFKARTHFKQVESLILRAVGSALASNERSGRLPKTTRIHAKPRKKNPGRFVRRTLDEGGRLVLKKYRGRRVRIEVAPAV